MKERMWRNGECKKTGGSEKRMEKVTRRESKNPTYSSYVQLLCTVPNITQYTTTVAKHSPLSASVN